MGVSGRASSRAPATRTTTGFVERDGVRVFYEVYGDGEPTILLLPDLVDRPLAPLEGADPVPGAPLPRRHVRRPRQRPLRPARAAPSLRARRVRRRRAGGDGRDRRPSAPSLVGVSCGALWAHDARRRPSRARARRRLHRPAVAARAGPPERERHGSFDEELDTDEGWAKYNRHYWPRDYRGFLEFFFAQCFNEPHSTKQIEDAVGWGLETTPETLADTTPRGSALAGPSAFARPVRARPLPGARDPRRRRPHPRRSSGRRARRGDRRRRSSRSRARATCPQARDPVKVNLLLRDFVVPRRRRPPPARRGRGRRAARAVRLARRSASATPGATSRSPTSCAGCIPTSRSTGSRRTRSRRCCEARGERDPPGERAPRQRVRPLRLGGGRARPALLPGAAAHGRDPARELHALPRRRPRGAATTSGSATRRGSSTTSCTRTRS